MQSAMKEPPLDMSDHQVDCIAEMITAVCRSPAVFAVESEYHPEWNQLSISVRICKMRGGCDLVAMEADLYSRIKACLDSAAISFSWGLGVFDDARFEGDLRPVTKLVDPQRHSPCLENP